MPKLRINKHYIDLIFCSFIVKYKGYAPNPNDVAITGFVMLFTLLFTAVWYKQKYSTYSHKMYEDNTSSEYYKG